MRRSLLAVPVLLLAATACGGGSHGSSTSAARSSTASAAESPDQFQAAMQIQGNPKAPLFALSDVHGHRVSLAAQRGRAVFLTFVYAHCPDTCPLILQNLALARRSLGPARKKLTVLAVSVDPKGDTPRFVRRFMYDRRLTGQINYLLGTRRQLAPVWRDYNVQTGKDASDPSSTALAHSALIIGIDRTGRMRTIYPASPLDPKVLAHDARLLARV